MSTVRQYRVRKGAYTRSMGSAMIAHSVQFDDNESMFTKFSSMPLFSCSCCKRICLSGSTAAAADDAEMENYASHLICTSRSTHSRQVWPTLCNMVPIGVLCFLWFTAHRTSQAFQSKV